MEYEPKTYEELHAECDHSAFEAIVSEDELTDMFGEGGKEEVKEYYAQ